MVFWYIHYQAGLINLSLKNQKDHLTWCQELFCGPHSGEWLEATWQRGEAVGGTALSSGSKSWILTRGHQTVSGGNRKHK